jgi:hypothetical protein
MTNPKQGARAPAKTVRPRIVQVEAVGQRFDCRLIRRGSMAPEVPGAFSASSHALRLLADATGFPAALSDIYGVDFTHGFTDLAVVEGIAADLRFLDDVDYRRAAIAELGDRTLAVEGLIVVRPGPGVWRRLAGDASAAVPDVPIMMLCQLLGAAGFAQLCDPALEAPVPLFVQPWRRGSGSLQPERLPPERFSAMLRVARLAGGRLVLCDQRSKVRETAGSGGQPARPPGREQPHAPVRRKKA